MLWRCRGILRTSASREFSWGRWSTSLAHGCDGCQLCGYEKKLQPGSPDGVVLDALEQIGLFRCNTFPNEKLPIRPQKNFLDATGQMAFDLSEEGSLFLLVQNASLAEFASKGIPSYHSGQGFVAMLFAMTVRSC